MVLWEKLIIYTQSTENVKYLRFYARDILLNGNIRIPKKIIEIRAIYLDTQRPRNAVHSVGST